MKNNVHFLSQRLDWQTPEAVYQVLDAEFKFDHDPCPYIKGTHHHHIDGLNSEWSVSNFVNPPYGRELPKWIKKGYEVYKSDGATVVFLIPSRTDTKWWHDYCMKATEIRFIKGRLKFKGAKNSAPFPSAIVIFRKAVKDERAYGIQPLPDFPSQYAIKEKINEIIGYSK